MQAGHGDLYGTNPEDYKQYSYHGSYIDVLKLIKEFRQKVNPKVNVFTVQTAGYNNVLIPETLYRGAILYGWTGKETQYAKELITIWDDFEQKND